MIGNSSRAYYEPDAVVRLRNHRTTIQMRWFRKFVELFRAQDGLRDFQASALKAHQSSEAIRKPILFGVEEDDFK